MKERRHDQRVSSRYALPQSDGWQVSPSGKDLPRLGAHRLIASGETPPTLKGVQSGAFFDTIPIVRKWKPIDPASTATEQMKAYCKAHPGSPTAARRPQLISRGDLWIALLGPSATDGIVCIGLTVEAALEAFDSEYLARLRPPPRSSKVSRTRSRRGRSPDKSATDFAF